MTSEKLLIELLEESALLNIREKVISLAKSYTENQPKLSRLEAYEVAFTKLQ